MLQQRLKHGVHERAISSLYVCTHTLAAAAAAAGPNATVAANCMPPIGRSSGARLSIDQ